MPEFIIYNKQDLKEGDILNLPDSLHQFFDFVYHLGQDPRGFLLKARTKEFPYEIVGTIFEKDWGQELEKTKDNKDEENHNYDIGHKSALRKSLKLWRLKNTLSKIFHPGNSLAIAFILSIIGLSLLGFGIACPPVLMFVALGFVAFSAVTAIIYAVHWLKMEALVFRNRNIRFLTNEKSVENGKVETSDEEKYINYSLVIMFRASSSYVNFSTNKSARYFDA